TPSRRYHRRCNKGLPVNPRPQMAEASGRLTISSARLPIRTHPYDALKLSFFPSRIRSTQPVGVNHAAAASTPFVISAKNISCFPGAPHPGGYAYWGVSISPHDAVGDVNDSFYQLSANCSNRVSGVDSSNKAGFGAVFIADSRDVLLVKQRCAN